MRGHKAQTNRTPNAGDKVRSRERTDKRNMNRQPEHTLAEKGNTHNRQRHKYRDCRTENYTNTRGKGEHRHENRERTHCTPCCPKDVYAYTSSAKNRNWIRGSNFYSCIFRRETVKIPKGKWRCGECVLCSRVCVPLFLCCFWL